MDGIFLLSKTERLTLDIGKVMAIYRYVLKKASKSPILREFSKILTQIWQTLNYYGVTY